MSTSYTTFLKTCASIKADAFQGVHAAPVYEQKETAHALFPFPEVYIWESLLELFQNSRPKGALASAVPYIWQLDPLVNAVARKLHAPSIAVQQKNIRLLLEFHAATSLDAIVTTPELVSELESTFKTIGNPPPILVVVHVCETAPSFSKVKSEVFSHTHNEIHLVPGLPIFVETTTDKGMRLSNLVSSTQQDDTCLITAKDPRLAHYINELELPFRLSERTGESFHIA